MTAGGSFFEAFGRTHLGGESGPLVRILDDMQDVPAVAELKRASYATLRLAPGSRVLDVGCGLGQDVERLAALVGPDGEAVGVDPSAHMVDRARTRAHGRFEIGAADLLPFADHAFDACRADRVLGYVADTAGALAEMRRVVRPGGVVSVCEMRFVFGGRAAEVEGGRPVLFERLYGEESSRGWIGLFVPLLLQRAGLRDVVVAEDERRLEAVEDVRRCLGLEAVLQTAGPEDARRLEDWWEKLGQEVADSTSWLTMHFFSFTGTR